MPPKKSKDVPKDELVTVDSIEAELIIQERGLQPQPKKIPKFAAVMVESIGAELIIPEGGWPPQPKITKKAEP